MGSIRRISRSLLYLSLVAGYHNGANSKAYAAQNSPPAQGGGTSKPSPPSTGGDNPPAGPPLGAPMEKDPRVGGAAMYPNKTIVENTVNSPIHKTLIQAVKSAGLVDTLNSAGPFTVFAPTDAAFAKLPAGTVDTLVRPDSHESLNKLLTYHVVAGKFTTKDLHKLILDGGGTASLKTVEGERLTFADDGSKIKITDSKGGTALITTPNVYQSNGVVQVVDSVLIP